MHRFPEVPKMLGEAPRGESSGSLKEQLMSEGVKEVFVAAVVLDDENGDRDPGASSIEQQAILSDSVIRENSSMIEVEV
ncbi:unnamed protein product [Rotaria sp. Silwood2]|nr:unnamed protein product [Rotaria sp. Silwood2]CAF2965580.1 unnamed protein product [Rotaria sp. Silwood2]CAF3369779.1 unnamed protein product [Rotaria sp. Silwood2]CAF4019616.1 unnamed protein product [Rotaria sp. Silwood2]CAF4226644.1 unnamed protein product [Rotaria sp. Silwood2]